MKRYREYGIWRLNDCEWWAGILLENVIRTAMETNDMERDEVFDDSYGTQPVDLKKTKVWICDLSEVPRNNKVKLFFHKLFYLRPYIYLLKGMIKLEGYRGKAFYFCGTEY